MMALLEDVAVLAALRSRHADAFTLFGAADMLRSLMGAPRQAAAKSSLTQRLAPSSDALGVDGAAAARQVGAGLSVDAAIARALASALDGDPA